MKINHYQIDWSATKLLAEKSLKSCSPQELDEKVRILGLVAAASEYHDCACTMGATVGQQELDNAANERMFLIPDEHLIVGRMGGKSW